MIWDFLKDLSDDLPTTTIGHDDCPTTAIGHDDCPTTTMGQVGDQATSP